MSSISSIRRIALTAVVAVAAVFCRSLLSQANGPTRPPVLPSKSEEIAKDFSAAADQWRVAAVDPKTKRDTVPANIRSERNEIWRPVLQEIRNTEQNGFLISEASEMARACDIARDPKDIWVVATFDHFLVIPIDSDEKLIYTEMSFKINQVIRQPHTSSLTTGGSFEVDEAGGSIKKANGDTEAWRLIPHEYHPRPGHTYLMQIGEQYNEGKGGLYFIESRWDLSTGKAVPDMNSLTCRDCSGNPAICGQTKEDAVSYLQSVLPVDSTK
jgi:hypothetical protein